MDDFESDHCPVCHKPVVVHDVTEIPESVIEHYKEHIYKPGEEIIQTSLTTDQQQQREQIKQFLDESRPPDVELQKQAVNGDK